jgi:O-antigen ligase
MYCAYLVASLAILITVRKVGWLRRGFVPFAGALIVAAVFSLSPGFGGLLLVLAFGVWCEWRRTRPRLAKLAIAASAIGATLFVLAITASPAASGPLSIWNLRPSSRMLTWRGSFSTFLAHPWLGKGVGLDVVEIGYTNPSGIYELLTDAHNAWLSVLAQEGLVGLAAFTAMIAALLRGTLRFSLTSRRLALQTGLTVAFVAGFLYQSLSGSFEDTRHVWVLIGLVAAVKDLPDSPGDKAAPASRT